MNGKCILDYLEALEQNNNRDWYHAHKAELLEANDAFYCLIGELAAGLREIDDTIPPADPRELTFKLTRDTRFSRDKSPYNPSFRAHIAPKGKLPIPVGYFLSIKPGNRSFLGGGLFADMFRDATGMVRDFIAANGEEWLRIISAPAFGERFILGGTALKNVPRGYDPTHPQAAYLKNKSWYLEAPIPDELLLGDAFIPYALETFGAMQPFNAFLNRALADFTMPSR